MPETICNGCTLYHLLMCVCKTEGERHTRQMIAPRQGTCRNSSCNLMAGAVNAFNKEGAELRKCLLPQIP